MGLKKTEPSWSLRGAVSTTERFFSPVFVHHAEAWHHAPQTYCGGGGDTACGLKNVGTPLLALTPFLTPRVGTFRRSVRELFGSERASDPLCPACFPGLVGLTGRERFEAALSDLLAPEAS